MDSPHKQMHRKQTDSSASDVSVLGPSSNNSRSKSIASGATKVFNKIGLKSRPSAIKPTTEEASTRFAIVHTPDRSPVSMPLSDIPTTNEEFEAAILRMNAQEYLRGATGTVENKDITGSGRKRTQHLPPCLSSVPETAITTPGSTKAFLGPLAAFLGPRDTCALESSQSSLNTPELTAYATPTSLRASGKVGPKYGRRVASDVVPPRPLSERALISSSVPTSPKLRTPHGSVSTPNTHTVLPVISNLTSFKKDDYISADSDEDRGCRMLRCQRSTESTATKSGGNTSSDDSISGLGVSPARNIRASQEMDYIQIMDDSAAWVPKRSVCYFCQQDCKPGDGLCNKCETRFQPQEEVFGNSESEYEDDTCTELEDSPRSSPKNEHPPATPPWSGKRKNTQYPRPREKSDGWSETSSEPRFLKPASRSASTSPTSHVALELKVVPPQDITIRTVASPTRTNAGNRRSALHHIQHVMKSRGSVSPGDQDRDAIRLGKVPSGEIRLFDYPDIVKAKPGTPNDNDVQNCSQEQQYESRGSFENWLKYYAEDDKNNERHIGPAWANPQGALVDNEISVIYDIYASLDDA